MIAKVHDCKNQKGIDVILFEFFSKFDAMVSHYCFLLWLLIRVVVKTYRKMWGRIFLPGARSSDFKKFVFSSNG